MALNIDQTKFLEEAMRKVKEQAFYMKHAMVGIEVWNIIPPASLWSFTCLAPGSYPAIVREKGILLCRPLMSLFAPGSGPFHSVDLLTLPDTRARKLTFPRLFSSPRTMRT